MDFGLTTEQELIRTEVRRFASEQLNDGVADRDRGQLFPRELWNACAGMGLPGLPVPADYGGAGQDAVSTAVALEALGYGCEDSGFVFSVCAHLLACVVPIWKFGSNHQKKAYLQGLCDGTLIAANAMTESESGSDAFALRTTAVRERKGYRITGTKIFVTNGPVADVALVFALTDEKKGYHGGITAFIVEANTPGFSQGQRFEKMGLRTSPLGELVFEDMFVPDSQVLGGEGGGSQVFLTAMEWERSCLSASHVGTMERLLEKAVAHARTRRQSGQAIGKFQAVSHKLADMKIQLEASRLLTYRSAWSLGRSRRSSLHAAISKTLVSESLVRSALDAIQVFGGYGFLTDFEIERSLRDAAASTTYSGTSEIQRNIIARWLGL